MERAEQPLILVLDDESLILIDIQAVLEDDGFTVVTSLTCQKALELVAAYDFDAAILDVNLGSGETCEAVAAKLRERNIPFLVHSGDLDRQGELVSTLGGPVVPKPTPSDTFPERIRQIL
jgi:DNA-binding response OmpR family regulator